MSNKLPIKDIARELYKGDIERFSCGEIKKDEANEMVKNAILDVCGCREKWNINKFMDNKYKVFQILSEVLAEPIEMGIVPQYQEWMDIKSVDYNTTYDFKVMDNSLFRSSVVATGTTDFHRQRLTKGKLALTSFSLGLAIYNEFHDLVVGNVDFAEMVNRVRASFDADIMNLVVSMIETAYNGLDTKYVVKGTYDAVKLSELVERVEAKSKKKAVIYGTRTALLNLGVLTDSDKEDIKNQGYVRMWNGNKVVIIPQSLNNNDEFVVSNKTLFVIPDGTKIVKLLLEGEPVIRESNEYDNDDQQIDFKFSQMIQVGVAKSSIYGMFVIQ